MGFEKLGPIQGHAAVATCRPSGSGRDIVHRGLPFLFVLKDINIYAQNGLIQKD